MSDDALDELIAFTHTPSTAIADILKKFKERLIPQFPKTRWGADIIKQIFPDTAVTVSKSVACEIVLDLLCIESVVAELSPSRKRKLRVNINHVSSVGALKDDFLHQTMCSCIHAVGAEAYNDLWTQLPAGLIRSPQREQGMKAPIKFYKDGTSQETGFSRSSNDYTRQRAFVTFIEDLPLELKVPTIASLYGPEERVTMERALRHNDYCASLGASLR